MDFSPKNLVGKVAVVGGGIGGIQCALDLAETGFYVYLLEKAHTLGGTMGRLDKTFPTNDCSTCMFSPKLVQVAGHPNVEIITLARVMELKGEAGRFRLRVERRPRFVNEEKCIACGQCAVKCPKRVPDPFNEGLGSRKAAFLTFPQAVPLKYALDPDHCLYLTKKRCGLCKKICPTQAVEFEQRPVQSTLHVGAVILSTGFALALTAAQGEYGFGRYKNVVTSLQYERILSATGPYGLEIRRPSDGKVPRSVAWIQCVMSRDPSRNRPFCSSVCCMHAAKQAVVTKSHERGTRTSIYFMDVRAHGKGFDEYVERARTVHGVRYKRSMISQVYLNPENDNLVIETFDHHLNQKVEEEYDLVVLSSGFQPSEDFLDLAERLGIARNAYGFLETEFDSPVETSRPGVFVCGGMEAPKDIPETVMQAGAAAAEASAILGPARNSETLPAKRRVETPIGKQPRIGVFVCHCGSNIAGVVDIARVVEAAKALPNVVRTRDFMFSCSSETQEVMVKEIQEHHLNRLVIAACSPKTHEPLFQETLRKAGLNPYLLEMANIRNQCSWVHGKVPEEATRKSIDLVRSSIARAAYLDPLQESTYPVTKGGLVIGGGVAGMNAALAIADQGFRVHLVEKTGELGGFARNLTETLEGNSPRRFVRYLEERVAHHRNITVHLDSRLVDHQGHIGAFEGTIEGPRGRVSVRYGAVVVATGGRAYLPEEYLYGKDERVLTQVELAEKMKRDPAWADRIDRVVMIQCVGSRNESFSYCSRVCCAAAVKNSLKLKEANPSAKIIILYRDMRTFGFMELKYLEARKKGVLFFRYIPEEAPRVYDRDGRLIVDFTDRSSHQDFRMQSDFVVLSAGIRPHEGAEEIAQTLKLPRTGEGFFLEAHVKLNPMEFGTSGIFLAGLAHSPRFIKESVIMAKGAAQQAMKVLCKDELRTPATVAVVDPELCSACLSCVRACPFGAPRINEDGVSEIPPAECRGCGICISECPAKAITLRHSSDEQMLAKVHGLLS